MSFTENENGSFVVWIIPIFVACLTLQIAKRWATSQNSSSTSTAVSRRRKIIKDPLIKRPVHTVPCKMSPPGPGAKKSAVAKKSTAAVAEEDINGKCVRRMPRMPSNSSTVQETKPLDVPIHPKHVPFPDIPHDGTLLFEAMNAMFVLVATGLQFLNLYRTAWWLPHSYTNQAMNFYLIDIHLVVFIVTLLSRRFILCIVQEAMKCFLTTKILPHILTATRLLVLGMIYSVLLFCLYVLLLKHPVVKIFFLCYPIVIYVFLFGTSAGAFTTLGSEAPPRHCCASEPEQIRAEVDAMRDEFNDRIKKIIFNSVLEAYYSSFIPCCFAQPYIYYDVVGAAQQTGLAWGALCARYCGQLLPAPHCDAAHRAALHLARWLPLRSSAEGREPWCSSRLYRGGSVVSRAGVPFAARGPLVAAEPGNSHHARFYSVFNNPSTLMCCSLCMQLALIVSQLCLLFSSMAWHNLLAIVVLLFINYYTLFKMIRDYLITFKIYKMETMIQEKNNLLTSN